MTPPPSERAAPAPGSRSFRNVFIVCEERFEISRLDVGGGGGGGDVGGAHEPHACECVGDEVGGQHACEQAAMPWWCVSGGAALPWCGVPEATACEPNIWKEALASCPAV